jgi:hypothetical protein
MKTLRRLRRSCFRTDSFTGLNRSECGLAGAARWRALISSVTCVASTSALMAAKCLHRWIGVSCRTRQQGVDDGVQLRRVALHARRTATAARAEPAEKMLEIGLDGMHAVSRTSFAVPRIVPTGPIASAQAAEKLHRRPPHRPPTPASRLLSDRYARRYGRPSSSLATPARPNLPSTSAARYSSEYPSRRALYRAAEARNPNSV